MTGLGQVAVSSTPGLLLYIAGGLAVMVLAILLIAFVVAPAFSLVGRFVRHVFRFLSAEVGDLLRVVGAVITICVLSFVTLYVIVDRFIDRCLTLLSYHTFMTPCESSADLFTRASLAWTWTSRARNSASGAT